MMLPLVYIIVLNWNNSTATLRCISSLVSLEYHNFRILVVDNGSSNESFNDLQSLGDKIEIIASPENLGYAGGNNLGILAALRNGADYVWLFNNDAVAEPDTLQKLINICEKEPAIGLASPILRDSRDVQGNQLGCALFDLSMPTFDLTFDLEQALNWQAEFSNRFAVVGTALLIRRAVIQRVGTLDDRYFAYWEDIDYSIRSIKAGFKNVLVPDSVVFHPSRNSYDLPNEAPPYYHYLITRNEILLWNKFCSRKTTFKAAIWTMLRQLRLVSRMPANMAGIDAILAGLWDSWRGIGGPYDPKRQMPEPIRTMLARQPRLCIALIEAALTMCKRPVKAHLPL